MSLMAALKENGDPRDMTYEPDEQRLVEVGGNGVMNLSNMFHDYCQLKRKDRELFVQQTALSFVHAQAELPEDYNEVRKDLRPKIWSRAAISHLELQARLAGGPAPDMPVYPLGDHLYSTLVYDLPNSMRSLTSDQFELWGVSYYEALEEARHNLQADTVCWSVMNDKLHSSISGDSYDSSRILLTDHISEMDLAGDPVAVVPNRDTLLVAGSDDPESLVLMMALAQQATEEETRPLCPLPVRLVDGEWKNWMPPSDHPAYPGFEQLETQFLGDLYATQKELFDAIYEKEGIDIFVASFSGIRIEEDSPVISYCVWPRDCDALLPEARYVVLVDDDGVQASGRWEDVINVAGNLMIVDDEFYPPRYRVREFPTQQQLEEIGVDEIFA